VWIGWLGKEIDPQDQPDIRRRLLKEYNCLPVFIADDLAEAYYNG
jgi:trehalose-6-phosphate synthase